MKRAGMIVAFVCVAIIQLGVPVGMIAKREATLRLGHAYKFRTAPVDPVDAFRGRYVWLNYEQHQAPWKGESQGGRCGTAFARIEAGTDGFAVVGDVGSQPPQSGDFVKVQNVYPGWGTNSHMAQFQLPFDRYYMEEAKAPRAEQAYREHQNRRGQTNHTTYAVVRIKDGDAVIENVILDGRPIAEFARSESK